MKTQALQTESVLRRIRHLESELEKLTRDVEIVSQTQEEIRRHVGLLDTWLRQHAEETLRAIAGIRATLDDNPPSNSSGDPAPHSGTRTKSFSGDQYRRLVKRTRALVLSELPSNSTFLVVSKGDDQLVKMDGLHGAHFPQAKNGVYAGAYPADSRDAINHLEELRSRQTIHYLIFPATAFWWLDHYQDFRRHLEKHYREFSCEPEICRIYELNAGDAEPAPQVQVDAGNRSATSQIQELVQALLPPAQALTVLGGQDGLSLDLRDRPLFWCRAQDKEAATIERIEELRVQGSQFLLVPSQLYGWLEGQTSLKSHLETRYRRITRQEHVCTIYSLSKASSETHGPS